MDGGYHAIETIFAFADDGDRLTGEVAAGFSLAISGPFGALLEGGDHENLVLRAARAMAEAFAPERGAALKLEKRLPVASGLGGGSADAAAAIRLLDRLWKLDRPWSDYEPLAAALGADVPACLHSRTAIGTGKGDTLSFVDVPGLGARHLLLANPGIAVSTAEIFQRWGGTDGGPLPPLRLDALMADARNDLEAPATALVPAIGDLLAAMRDDSEFARMSGSGASCFALFSSRHDAVTSCEKLRARFPEIWTMTTPMHAPPLHRSIARARSCGDMKRLALLLPVVLLAACNADDTGSAEAQSDVSTADGKIDCALAGNAEFSRKCSADRISGPDRELLVIHHPDGGFQRFEIVSDGRGLVAADGFDDTRIELLDDDMIEVTAGDDRYRLPARIKSGSAQSGEPSQPAQPSE